MDKDISNIKYYIPFKSNIQKVIVCPPKFTLSLERTVLIKPDGTEIDCRDLMRHDIIAKKGRNPNG